MPTYVKRPIEVQAVQWFKDGDHIDVFKSYLSKSVQYFMETLEGHMNVVPGDWIITGSKGGHYLCKDEIFRATYDEVERMEFKTSSRK